MKFFRKVRYDLMEKNKTGKYLKYAIGEIVLVVIGILIALQINDWNDNRKLENIRQNYYQQILLDLKADKKYLERKIVVFDSLVTRYDNYRETFKNGVVKFDVAYAAILNNNFLLTSIEFQTTTIESLISNGDTKLLDANIREELTQFNAKKVALMDTYNFNQDNAGSIFQIALMNGFASFLNLQEQAELLDYLNLKAKEPELFLQLEAYLFYKDFAENAAMNRCKGIIEDLDILIDHVNHAIEK